jgi:hypothetical protein
MFDFIKKLFSSKEKENIAITTFSVTIEIRHDDKGKVLSVDGSIDDPYCVEEVNDD